MTIFTLAGLWVTVIYVAVPCCTNLSNNASDQNEEADRRAEQSAGCSEAPTWPVVSDEKEATSKDSLAPSKSECENLKTQRRVAVANERLVTLTCHQTWLAIIGTAGLGLTVFLTYRATKAAARSAEVAERVLIDLERPYVFVCDVRPYITTRNHVPHFPYVEYCLKNMGRSPAILIELRAKIFILPEVPEISPASSLPGIAEFVALSSSEKSEPKACKSDVPSDAEMISKLEAGTLKAIFVGMVTYEDAAGVKHSTKFGYQWRPSDGSYVSNQSFVAIDKAGYNTRR